MTDGLKGLGVVMHRGGRLCARLNHTNSGASDELSKLRLKRKNLVNNGMSLVEANEIIDREWN